MALGRPLALHPEAPFSLNGTPRSVTYVGKVPCFASGQFGFSVRVLPKHADLPHPFEPGLVTWG